MGNVISLKGSREAPRAERSAMETIIVTAGEIGGWRIPPFQRPVRINSKVSALSEEISLDGGIIKGILTLGRVKGDGATYVVDGQHRLEAFRISGLPEFMADVRVCDFDSMADMAEEFVRLNTALVKMRPDDILRGLESSVPALHKIRQECRFVGYDQIRRGTSSPIVGMSQLLRCWYGSAAETPTSSQLSAAQIAQSIDAESTEQLINFLTVAHAAWGRDAEYARLWSALNLGLCMWLWRRLVLDGDRSGNKRYVTLNIKQFRDCLMGLSASSTYLEWLQGRALTDRDRGPAYHRIKKIFGGRIIGKKVVFPQPAWVTR